MRLPRAGLAGVVACSLLPLAAGWGGSSTLASSTPLSPLDPSFGTGSPAPGVVIPDAGPCDRRLVDAVPAAGGTVVAALAASTHCFGWGDQTRIARYRPDGSPDPAFGVAGLVTLPAVDWGGEVNDVSVDGAGRVLVARTSRVDRLLPSGAVDPAFEPIVVPAMYTPGVVGPDPPFRTILGAVPDSTGRVVVWARLDSLNYVARYTADGVLDPSFASDAPVPGARYIGLDVIADPIVVAGDRVVAVGTYSGYDDRTLVIRLTSFGATDATFGGGSGSIFGPGIAAFDGTPGDETAVHVVEDALGRLVVIGFPPDLSSMVGSAFAARLGPTGTVDPGFSTASSPTMARFMVPRATLVRPDGRMAIVGNLPHPTLGVPGPPVVVVLGETGAPDPFVGWPNTFNGVTEVTGSSVFENAMVMGAADTNGAIYLWSPDRYLARLRPPQTVGGLSGFNPVAPDRILDTRNGLGAARGKVAAGSVLRLQVTGTPNVPGAGVRAVTMNVTAVEPEAGGFVTVYPCGGPPPNVSNLNYELLQTVPNLVTVPVAPDGSVCLFTYATTHLLADVAGWYGVGGSGFRRVAPERLVDTRQSWWEPPGPLAADGVLRVQVAGRAGVPASGARAVTMNVTVVESGAPGFVTVYPCGGAPPNVSNLNFFRGQTVPNLVTVPIASDGTVCLYSSARTHLLVDVAGWFGATGAGFAPVEPDRVLDTRVGVGAPVGTVQRLGVLRLQVAGTRTVPHGVQAVTMNVTAVDPRGAGFVTAFACDGPTPNVSNLNVVYGRTVPNLVTVPVAADGTVCLFADVEMHMLADVAGWFG